jgi:hypothetical protein
LIERRGTHISNKASENFFPQNTNTVKEETLLEGETSGQRIPSTHASIVANDLKMLEAINRAGPGIDLGLLLESGNSRVKEARKKFMIS